MRVVHIELHAEEKVAHLLGRRGFAVDVALYLVALDSSRHADEVHVLVPRRRLILVCVVELQGDRGFGDARVATFVDKVLRALGSDR